MAVTLLLGSCEKETTTQNSLTDENPAMGIIGGHQAGDEKIIDPAADPDAPFEEWDLFKLPNPVLPFAGGGGAETEIPVATPTKEAYIKHNIQLQLYDTLGFPVDGTQFWVTIDVIKNGPLVTLQIPLINFQTGQVSTENPFYPSGELVPGIPPAGGYLYTAAGFLPKHLRPSSPIPQSVVATSNNGLSPVYSFDQPAATLPNPPAGYILQVTNAGEIQVQGAGNYGNIIAAGPQIMMPVTITYLAEPERALGVNLKISTGASDTTQFTGGPDEAAGTGFRDSHVIDAFEGKVVFAWTDNSNIPQNINTLNVMVAVGEVDKDGQLKVGKPVQLTDLPPQVYAWDTAAAIVRAGPHKGNVIVSYSVLNAPGTPCRAVSVDGGKTWPAPYNNITPQLYNGPINTQPTGVPGGNGDDRGVSSDKFGNVWYSTTNFYDGSGNIIDQPYFAVSTDGGITYTVAYTAPLLPLPQGFDFPQYCFGGDGMGHYGLWWQSSNFVGNGDIYPNVGFIQIPGPIKPSDFPLTTEFTPLAGFVNSFIEAHCTASADGRVWFQGEDNSGYTDIGPVELLFKSPGPIDQNYSGTWDIGQKNFSGGDYLEANLISQPYFGYFNAPVELLYDEKRQALYSTVSTQTPTFSQDMGLYLVISRDNGMTWSEPLSITTTNFANRGFQSMALDPHTGDLVFGWYDGRNDPTYKSVEYYGAVVPAHTLDRLVDRIPLSNPTFVEPSSAPPPSN